MPNNVAEPKAKQASHIGESNDAEVSPPTPQTEEEQLLANGVGLLTLQQVADLLKEDKRIIDYQRKSNELIAIDMNGEYLYPDWQFNGGQLSKGFDRVLAALNNNGLSLEGKMIFFTANNRELNNRTAIECLQSGYSSIDEVVLVASRHGLHCG
jgi:hypothetical protein